MTELQKHMIEAILDDHSYDHDTVIPELYHYTSSDSILSILGISRVDENPKLWFTQYDSLNDKKEREDVLDCFYEYCIVKQKEGLISDSLLKELCKINLSNFKFVTYNFKLEKEEFLDVSSYPYKNCDTYLCCFSSNDDLLPMWNYYTKNNRHEGYNIGFSIKNAIKYLEERDGFFVSVKKVIYTKEEKYRIFDKMFPRFFKCYSDANPENNFIVLNFIQFILEGFQHFFKNESFAYEKEIRIILSIPEEKRKEGIEGLISSRKYRNSNGYIVPYVELSLNKPAIQSITVAPLLEKELAEKNLRDMLDDNGYEHVKVKSSKVPIRF